MRQAPRRRDPDTAGKPFNRESPAGGREAHRTHAKYGSEAPGQKPDRLPVRPRSEPGAGDSATNWRRSGAIEAATRICRIIS